VTTSGIPKHFAKTSRAEKTNRQTANTGGVGELVLLRVKAPLSDEALHWLLSQDKVLPSSLSKEKYGGLSALAKL